MSRRRWAIAVVVLGLVATGLLLLRQAVAHGWGVHDPPSRMEAWAARQVRRWAVPAELRRAVNPVAPGPEILDEARAHFADHCATCHGNDGRGLTTIGARLYPPAPDLNLAGTQSLSDGELFSIIENGIRLTGMPGWGDGTAESGYASWALVHFIRHLPRLTPAEVAAMERSGPVGSIESDESGDGAPDSTAADADHPEHDH